MPNRGRTEIGGFAATYKGNGLLTSDSLLESGSPNDLVDRLDYLQKPAQHETRALDGFLAARLAAKDADNQTMLAQQKADSAAGRARGALAGAQAAQLAADQDPSQSERAGNPATAGAGHGKCAARRHP